MHRLRNATVLGAALALLSPAAGAADPVRYLDEIFTTVDVATDVEFGSTTNNRGETQTLYLDLYTPRDDGATDRAAIIFAHGGGFRDLSRKDARTFPILEGWARRGFVVATIDYRLRPADTPNARSNPELIVEAAAGDSETIREAQHDMQAAVRWVRDRAWLLGVDPDRIAVAGESAGGITAFETAINPEDPGASGTPGVSSEVSAAVSLWGAADPDHVEPGVPPVLEIHGVLDTTVPLPLGAQACALVNAVGSTCEMLVWPTEGHAAFGRAEEILEVSSSFLCRHAIPGCSDEGPLLPVTVSP